MMSNPKILEQLMSARKRLEWLNNTWPWDGWEGAADARAAHHKQVLETEALIAKLEQSMPT